MTTKEQINKAIKAWLAAKKHLSGSTDTERHYRKVIDAFRARLQEQGKDLDLANWVDRRDEDAWRTMIAEFLFEVEEFASTLPSDPSRQASPSTFCARVSALFSFYEFALDRGHFPNYANPIAKIRRPKVPLYGNVKALDARDVAKAMQAIDRSTLSGKRDYALLIIFLETAQRKSAVQMLRWKDVELLGKLEDIKRREDIALALNFPRVKGGKKARYELSSEASVALLTWLAHVYQINPLFLDGQRPLWVNLKTISSVREPEQLANNGITAICKNRLGTTHVHRLRHTVAQECLRASMPLTDIQQFLGHSNLATLTAYLEALSPPGKNSKIDVLHQVFGISHIAH